MKTIKHYDDIKPVKNNWKLDYIKYRANKHKHELWLKSRKSDFVYMTAYDKFILDNLQEGQTGTFGSTYYHLEDCIENLTVIEQKPIVKKFYPKATIVKEREDIGRLFPKKFNNFIVTFNRSDHWHDHKGIVGHVKKYQEAMAPGCLFFYSLRDTMWSPWNRLKINHYKFFVDLAKQIEQIGFKCKQSQINFANGDGNENPDTTDGNIKFMFRCIK